MGKRELLIIVAFIAIGVGAYQLTAPASKPGEGFSISRLWQNTRTSVRGYGSVATDSRSGTIALSSSVRQLRVSGPVRKLQVTGGDRRDLGYELIVESSARDLPEAERAAKAVTLVEDALDTALDLRLHYPKEGSQTATLVLRVPAGLAVRIDSNSTVTATGLASLEIESSGGSFTVDGVAGAVTGYHRNSDITIRDVGSVDLTLAGSRARFWKVAGRLQLNARQGRSEIADTSGPVEIDGASQEIQISRADGPIRLTGRDGRVTIDDPRQETHVEVRACEVTVTLRRPAPLSIITIDRPLRLFLDGVPAVIVDAVASDGGRVTAEDFGLSPESGAHDQRLRHTFGDAGASAPRVTLRNQRGNIVIGQAK